MSEQTPEENEEALTQIQSNAEKGTSKLVMNRVPDSAISEFKNNAHERWAGDYGMYLTYLLEIDRLRNQYDQKFTATAEKVQELQDDIRQLQDALQKEEPENEAESSVNTIR